ncbi:PREDICTED: telomere repeat-binding protein 5-like isoform X2 [Nelumbo nucifera]|uniref:Telomere repeat-binding protein 5-like isoform X2 n=1 Tax=Nelumbo nucifera TaxID=4432 RepID=A0A1U8A682_NELNU|nr:PREDICTED: telomere repeat-binding protein 5-like isoform X2 [Nelumbo nucifera]
MVLQKRLEYGFNGYQVPRASRSARGRGSVRKKVHDNPMCAFDLLATVAGKLLQEGESSPAPAKASARNDQNPLVKHNLEAEQQDEERTLKVEPFDQGSCNESVLVSGLGSEGHNRTHFLKENPQVQNAVALRQTPATRNLNYSEKFTCAEKFIKGKSRNEFGCIPSKERKGSPSYGESYGGKVEDGTVRERETQKIGSVINGTLPDSCSSEDPMEVDRKPPALISSDSSVDIPLCRDPISFPDDDVKVVNRDDDENSSGCTQPSPINVKFRPSGRIGDRRIRKLFASKYWKAAPKLSDGEISKPDGEMKPFSRNRKTCCTRQRSQRNSPFKKRKLLDQSSVSTSDGGISSIGISNSAEKGVNEVTIGSASGTSSSVAGQQTAFQPRDSHVRLSIKSFRVPELVIEIPETETVGSLKRTVMEAVTAVLGGGLRVGVLLQGKKVRDDNKTLLQAGISNDNKLDALGFTLEPNPTNSPPPVCPEDPPFLLPCDAPQPINRYPTPAALDPGTSEVSLVPPMTNLANCVESDHDSVPSPIDVSKDKITPDSRTLVAIPAMSVEALAVVPFNRKSRQSELVQRRIRRPFSVSEVEALVQAVEKLGTGRWRDVKLRAFDNAKHRTYVDLKDKWKTLVHTARISPQQRRGEPVPQELLDRVLSAHAYWSQQQAKQQQVKQQSETCLLL